MLDKLDLASTTPNLPEKNVPHSLHLHYADVHWEAHASFCVVMLPSLIKPHYFVKDFISQPVEEPATTLTSTRPGPVSHANHFISKLLFVVLVQAAAHSLAFRSWQLLLVKVPIDQKVSLHSVLILSAETQ